MIKRLLVVMMALAIALSVVKPAAAVTGGVPDENGHPYSGLILLPGGGFCSGTLIAPTVVLTAGHCTSFFESVPGAEVWVTFDPYAAVDLDTWEPIPGEGTWYTASTFVTHPDYVDANWPFTADYGLVILDQPVVGITPATLPEPYLVDQLTGTTGQTDVRFNDVGYGQSGVDVGGGPPIGNFDFIRLVSTQRWSPSRGAVGTLDPLWLILRANPSKNHGSGCGGDSGSGIFVEGTDTIVAVHTGGYRLGWEGQLCGRITSLNHRVDVPLVLDWLAPYVQ